MGKGGAYKRCRDADNRLAQFKATVAERDRENTAAAACTTSVTVSRTTTTLAPMTLLEADAAERERVRLSDLRLADGAARALAAGAATRPRNTALAYVPKQMEFKEWCKGLDGQGGDNVTEDKMVLFLQECVIGRSLRTPGGRKRKRTDESSDDEETLAAPAEGEGAVQEAGGETPADSPSKPATATASDALIKMYVAAIGDLAKQQMARRQIPEHTFLRGAKLQSLMDSTSRNEYNRRRRQLMDRAKGTIADTYGRDDIVRLSNLCWSKCTDSREQIRAFLRTNLDFLLGHAMLLRGENRREMQLADLLPVVKNSQGPTQMIMLIVLVNKTKTNQTNVQEYAACSRHKDYRVCPISNLAFYLYYLWDVCRESRPEFHTRGAWYERPVLTGRKKGMKMSYEMHRDWLSKCFTEAKTPTLKKTHATRLGGAQMAIMEECPVDEVARAGFWASDALNKHYLKGFPMKHVRTMAGFGPQLGEYFIPRAAVQPPEEVKQQVWPWVDEWQRWLGHSEEDNRAWDMASGGRPFKHINPPEVGTADYTDSDYRTITGDLSTKQFLALLQHLRTILLQDSVYRRKEQPDHPIFNCPVFHSPSYTTFAAELEIAAATEAQEVPEHIRIKDVVPDVARGMRILQDALSAEMSAGFERQLSGTKALAHKLDMFAIRPSITYHSADLEFHASRFSNKLSGQRHCLDTAGWPKTIDPALTQRETTPSPIEEPAPDALPTGDSLAVQSIAAAAPAALDISQPSASSESTVQGSRTVRSRTGLVYKLPLDTNPKPVLYTLCRTSATVSDLWREWTVGVAGNPAVFDLNRLWGAAWRKDRNVSMWHCRRSKIITAIKRLADIHTEAELVQALKDSDPATDLPGSPAVQRAVAALEKRCEVDKLSLNRLGDLLTMEAAAVAGKG